MAEQHGRSYTYSPLTGLEMSTTRYSIDAVLCLRTINAVCNIPLVNIALVE